MDDAAVRRWRPDARYFQIAALSTLMAVNLALVDLGARWEQCALALAAALLTQVAGCRLTRTPLDLKSPVNTSLSLGLLLRADALWLHGLAGIIAIGSKFLLRQGGKHVFNPAGFAIVVLLATSSSVWISPR